jgi:hypothetical protein
MAYKTMTLQIPMVCLIEMITKAGLTVRKVIVLSAIRVFTTSDYTIGICKVIVL